MARLHIIGNSIAYGFSDQGSDWSSLLKNEANRRHGAGERPKVTVVNLSSPGNLLTHYLDSGFLSGSISCNARGRQIGLLGVGACESSILRSRGAEQPRRSLHEFTRDLAHLGAIVCRFNDTHPLESRMSALFMSATPVHFEKARCTPEGDEFRNDFIREYDAVVANYAAQNSMGYIDVHTGFDTDSMLADDGIHLNQTGNEFVYRRVTPAIIDHFGLDRDL